MGKEGIPLARSYDLIVRQDVLEHTPNPLEIVTSFAHFWRKRDSKPIIRVDLNKFPIYFSGLGWPDSGTKKPTQHSSRDIFAIAYFA